jgi:hypothetical protein
MLNVREGCNRNRRLRAESGARLRLLLLQDAADGAEQMTIKTKEIWAVRLLNLQMLLVQ